MNCLITKRISAPCSLCGQYDDHVHLVDAQAFYCETCCPVHNAVALVEPLIITTTRGRQRILFEEA